MDSRLSQRTITPGKKKETPNLSLEGNPAAFSFCHYKVICFYFFLGLITNFLQGCPCGGIHFGLPAFFGSAKDSRSGISRAS